VFEVEVLEPTCPGISIQEIVVDSVSCYGENNGSITMTMSGGTLPFTYSIPGIQPVTVNSASHTFNGLGIGEYWVSVTDGAGCFVPYPTTVEVFQPEALASSIVTIPPCAGESNGVICLNPENGTPWYSYNIEFDDDPVTVVEGAHPECGGAFYAENLEAGSYHIELVDDNGCLAHGVTSVPEVTVAAAAETEPDCSGTSAGSIDLTAGGGNAPYNFEWSTGSMDEDLDNLEEGSYTVTVTDNRGCTNISNFTVGLEDLALNFAVAETCEEQDAGVIITAVTNGIPGYDFNWSNGTNTTNETISGLALGDYTVTVTDARGCTAIGGTTVTEYDMVAQMVVDPTCEGQNNGFVGANPSAGIPNFVYAWSDGTDGGIITDLAPGDYTVTITDENGCSAIGTGTVEEYALNVALDIADVCSGADSGAITATVENAEAPVAYIWSNGDNGNPVGNLNAGDYTVSITDALGCQATASGTVNEFDAPTATASEDVTIQEGESTTISVNANGGSGPYTYQWFPSNVDSPNSESTLAYPFETTTYTVIVTDSNGCTAEAQVTITVVPPVVLVMPNAFSPNGDQNNDVFRPFVPNDNADIRVFQIFDRWGKLLHNDPGPWDGTFNDKEQPVGSYVYVVEYYDLLNRKTTLKGHFNLVR
jgi:gliding motility-associated-like protein